MTETILRFALVLRIKVITQEAPKKFLGSSVDLPLTKVNLKSGLRRAFLWEERCLPRACLSTRQSFSSLGKDFFLFLWEGLAEREDGAGEEKEKRLRSLSGRCSDIAGEPGAVVLASTRALSTLLRPDICTFWSVLLRHLSFSPFSEGRIVVEAFLPPPSMSNSERATDSNDWCCCSSCCHCCSACSYCWCWDCCSFSGSFCRRPSDATAVPALLGTATVAAPSSAAVVAAPSPAVSSVLVAKRPSLVRHLSGEEREPTFYPSSRIQSTHWKHWFDFSAPPASLGVAGLGAADVAAAGVAGVDACFFFRGKSFINASRQHKTSSEDGDPH